MRPSSTTATELERKPVILVVEDEFLIRMMISDHLREEGFVVIEAGSTDEAQQVLAAGHKIDLVFTDVRLPGEIDGLELAKRLLDEGPVQRVVVTSAHVRYDEMEGVAPFIPKPYQPDVVIATIRDCLKW